MVDRETTIEDIYQHLKRLCLVPRTGPRRFYFTYLGRRVEWETTIGTLGLDSLSHLHLNFSVPGGATGLAFSYHIHHISDSSIGSSEAGSSRPARKIDRSKMTNAIDELGAPDSDDAAPGKKRKRRVPRKNQESRAKGKEKATENSDPEDEDFSSGGSSDESDSGIEEVISNEEVHDISDPGRDLIQYMHRLRSLFLGRQFPRTQNGTQLAAINPPRRK